MVGQKLLLLLIFVIAVSCKGLAMQDDEAPRSALMPRSTSASSFQHSLEMRPTPFKQVENIEKEMRDPLSKLNPHDLDSQLSSSASKPMPTFFRSRSTLSNSNTPNPHKERIDRNQGIELVLNDESINESWFKKHKKKITVVAGSALLAGGLGVGIYYGIKPYLEETSENPLPIFSVSNRTTTEMSPTRFSEKMTIFTNESTSSTYSTRVSAFVADEPYTSPLLIETEEITTALETLDQDNFFDQVTTEDETMGNRSESTSTNQARFRRDIGHYPTLATTIRTITLLNMLHPLDLGSRKYLDEFKTAKRSERQNEEQARRAFQKNNISGRGSRCRFPFQTCDHNRWIH